MRIYLFRKTITEGKNHNKAIEGTVSKQVKDLLFPMHCPICDCIIERKKGLICPECKDVPRLVKAPRCACCGKHLERAETVYCRDCSGLKRSFDKGIALYEYSSVHDSVFAFKNMGRAEYAEFYGREILRWLQPSIMNMRADALIPIPLHASKMRKRGYNQASLLAEEISKGCGIPVREDILKRVKETDAQKKMDHATRQNNMKKAFHMVQNDVKLKTVILVDDVFTTGKTLEEAAAELKRGGMDKVYFVALAIGKGL